VALRDFVDSFGVHWRVWPTIPPRGTIRDTKFGNGWLTFASAGVRRRLAPIPIGWEEAALARLELMCRAAEDVRMMLPFIDLGGGSDELSRS
jgi:hypothetical protein